MSLSYFDKESINFVENLDFFANQVVEGFLTGLHKSPFHGFSVEFAEHRMYNNGDSIKNIDWKLFARSDKLFIKRFEEETNLRCHLVIDSSSSMYFPLHLKNNKLNFSLLSSACLMNLFRRQRDAFGITFFSDEVNFHSEAKLSKKHYFRLIHELEKNLLEKEKKSRKTLFSKVLNELAQRIPKRSLIIIFSDLHGTQKKIDELFNSLKEIKHKKNEIILFHVQDFNREKLFNFSNQPHEFSDLENHNKIQLNPSSYKKIYAQLYNDFQKELELYCHQYKIDYVPAFIQDGFSKVLLSYLTKRSKLF